MLLPLLLLLIGFVCGVFSLLLITYAVLFNVFGRRVGPPPFIDQFLPPKIPHELIQFLRQPNGGSEWESCYSITLLLHFLFQEHRDTRKIRRWIYKRLQLELNDITTRSSMAGNIIQGIQIRELSVGTQFPIIKSIKVENSSAMADDSERFERIAFLLDVEYRGGFEVGVDANLIMGRKAQLSIKIIKLAGKARVVLTRHPFAHWTFSFVEMPELDFKIESQWQGRQLKHVIPLITQAFRQVLQRKHVDPNFKVRFRPILPNPLLQPSPPISSFDHVKVSGTGLEVTILQCTRLNTKLAGGTDSHANNNEVYCTILLGG